MHVYVCDIHLMLFILAIVWLTHNFYTCSKISKAEDETQEYDFSAEIYGEQPSTCTSASLICDKEQKISDLEEKLKEREEECDRYRQQLEIERFGIHRFSTDNSPVSFYTGFPSYLMFVTFFNCVKPAASNMQSAYYTTSEIVSLAGRKRNMLLIDELFMFLCRLKAGLLEQDLSVRFNCSVSTISRKIVTWANFLYFVLGSIPIWLLF